VTESPQEAYDRGAVQGGIAERLASHDRHFEAINGNLARVADEMHGLRLAVQRLGDAQASDRTTAVTTAAALKAAEDARRAKSESAWTPMARFLAVVGGVVAVISVTYLILRPS